MLQLAESWQIESPDHAMSRTLEISSLLRPDLGNVSTTPQQFACIIDAVGELADDASCPIAESLVHSGKYLNWLRLYELPDACLVVLNQKLTTQSEDMSHVINAIEKVLEAREMFRNSLTQGVLDQALERNELRSRIESDLGHSIDKGATYAWAKKQGKFDDFQEIFDGFFMDLSSQRIEKEPDLGPILMAAKEADRII